MMTEYLEYFFIILCFFLFVYLLYRWSDSNCASGSKSANWSGDILNHAPLLVKPVVLNKINVYTSDASGNRFTFSQIRFNEPIYDHAIKFYANVNTFRVKQDFDGFGGSFTDAACMNIMKLSEDKRRNIIRDYFHPKEGLGYLLGRTPIGGSDFSTRPYTLDDVEDDYELEHFALTQEDLEYKIPVIKMAMIWVPNLKLISSVWSPPVWLKSNKRINHRGHIVGNVTDKAFVTYAKYFIKFLDAYKKAGIKIYGISPANEPHNGRYIPFFPFNCVGFSAIQMRDFIVQTLGPQLHAAGYTKDKLKIFINDDQRLYMKKWVNTVMAHPNASDYVTHFAFHWYMNNFSSAKVLDEIKGAYPDIEGIWSTEACNGAYPFIHKHVEINSWSRAEQYAVDIIEDFNHYTNGWIDWNLALDRRGGPNWAKNYVDASIIIDVEQNEYIRQPMFYAIAHFSKFIKPRSRNLWQRTRLSGKPSYVSGGVHIVSYKREDRKYVSVVCNTMRRSVFVTIQTDENEDLMVRHIVPKKSITTFIWSE